MSRIRKAYEARFRALLIQLGARRPEAGIQWLLTRAQHESKTRRIPLPNALTDVYKRLQEKVPLRASQDKPSWKQSPTGIVGPRSRRAPPSILPRVFICDAGLGGLARWMRAAGYEAVWIPDISDAALLREAQLREAMILTTDSMLMERRLLRDGIIPALWLPPTLTMHEQLALVFQELGLKLREPRCMSCGGELRRVEKETIRDRIPPKTWRWVDDYFLCERCDKLFWRGTHWQRIRTRLSQLQAGPRSAT